MKVSSPPFKSPSDAGIHDRSTDSGFSSQFTQQLLQPATSCAQDSNSNQDKSPRENKKEGERGDV